MPKIYNEIMRFEVKTDKNRFSDKKSFLLSIIILVYFAFLLLNISFNLNKLSRFYEINYLCNLLLVDKSPSNFSKLSKLTNKLKKPKVWEFCREFTKSI